MANIAAGAEVKDGNQPIPQYGANIPVVCKPVIPAALRLIDGKSGPFPGNVRKTGVLYRKMGVF